MGVNRSKALLLLVTILLANSPTSINATQVSWSGNQYVDPKHKAAHDAPRSQKYWDEHGIERPDYAKTDAEIAAERRQRGGESSIGWQTWMGTLTIIVYVAFGVAAVSSIGYGTYTGDWSVIINNPVTEFIDQCINRILETGGMRGHKLGSTSVASQSIQNASEEEKRRLARIARFENAGKDLLDSMKED